LGTGLALNHLPKNGRVQRCECAETTTNKLPRRAKRRTRHRTKLRTTCRSGNVGTLPSQDTRHIPCKRFTGFEEPLLVKDPLQTLKRRTLTGFLTDTLPPTQTSQRSFFRRTGYGTHTCHRGRNKLLYPTLKLTTDGGLFGLWCWF
jgi:hypothetical protein